MPENLLSPDDAFRRLYDELIQRYPSDRGDLGRSPSAFEFTKTETGAVASVFGDKSPRHVELGWDPLTQRFLTAGQAIHPTWLGGRQQGPVEAGSDFLSALIMNRDPMSEITDPFSYGRAPMGSGDWTGGYPGPEWVAQQRSMHFMGAHRQDPSHASPWYYLQNQADFPESYPSVSGLLRQGGGLMYGPLLSHYSSFGGIFGMGYAGEGQTASVVSSYPGSKPREKISLESPDRLFRILGEPTYPTMARGIDPVMSPGGEELTRRGVRRTAEFIPGLLVPGAGQAFGLASSFENIQLAQSKQSRVALSWQSLNTFGEETRGRQPYMTVDTPLYGSRTSTRTPFVDLGGATSQHGIADAHSRGVGGYRPLGATLNLPYGPGLGQAIQTYAGDLLDPHKGMRLEGYDADILNTTPQTPAQLRSYRAWVDLLNAPGQHPAGELSRRFSSGGHVQFMPAEGRAEPSLSLRYQVESRWTSGLSVQAAGFKGVQTQMESLSRMGALPNTDVILGGESVKGEPFIAEQLTNLMGAEALQRLGVPAAAFDAGGVMRGGTQPGVSEAIRSLFTDPDVRPRFERELERAGGQIFQGWRAPPVDRSWVDMFRPGGAFAHLVAQDRQQAQLGQFAFGEGGRLEQFVEGIQFPMLMSPGESPERSNIGRMNFNDLLAIATKDPQMASAMYSQARASTEPFAGLIMAGHGALPADANVIDASQGVLLPSDVSRTSPMSFQERLQGMAKSDVFRDAFIRVPTGTNRETFIPPASHLLATQPFTPEGGPVSAVGQKLHALLNRLPGGLEGAQPQILDYEQAIFDLSSQQGVVRAGFMGESPTAMTGRLQHIGGLGEQLKGGIGVVVPDPAYRRVMEGLGEGATPENALAAFLRWPDAGQNAPFGRLLSASQAAQMQRQAGVDPISARSFRGVGIAGRESAAAIARTSADVDKDTATMYALIQSTGMQPDASLRRDLMTMLRARDPEAITKAQAAAAGVAGMDPGAYPVENLSMGAILSFAQGTKAAQAVEPALQYGSLSQWAGGKLVGPSTQNVQDLGQIRAAEAVGKGFIGLTSNFADMMRVYMSGFQSSLPEGERAAYGAEAQETMEVLTGVKQSLVDTSMLPSRGEGESGTSFQRQIKSGMRLFGSMTAEFWRRSRGEMGDITISSIGEFQERPGLVYPKRVPVENEADVLGGFAFAFGREGGRPEHVMTMLGGAGRQPEGIQEWISSLVGGDPSAQAPYTNAGEFREYFRKTPLGAFFYGQGVHKGAMRAAGIERRPPTSQASWETDFLKKSRRDIESGEFDPEVAVYEQARAVTGIGGNARLLTPIEGEYVPKTSMSGEVLIGSVVSGSQQDSPAGELLRRTPMAGVASQPLQPLSQRYREQGRAAEARRVRALSSNIANFEANQSGGAPPIPPIMPSALVNRGATGPATPATGNVFDQELAQIRSQKQEQARQRVQAERDYYEPFGQKLLPAPGLDPVAEGSMRVYQTRLRGGDWDPFWSTSIGEQARHPLSETRAGVVSEDQLRAGKGYLLGTFGEEQEDLGFPLDETQLKVGMFPASGPNAVRNIQSMTRRQAMEGARGDRVGAPPGGGRSGVPPGGSGGGGGRPGVPPGDDWSGPRQFGLLAEHAIRMTAGGIERLSGKDLDSIEGTLESVTKKLEAFGEATGDNTKLMGHLKGALTDIRSMRKLEHDTALADRDEMWQGQYAVAGAGLQGHLGAIADAGFPGGIGGPPGPPGGPPPAPGEPGGPPLSFGDRVRGAARAFQGRVAGQTHAMSYFDLMYIMNLSGHLVGGMQEQGQVAEQLEMGGQQLMYQMGYGQGFEPTAIMRGRAAMTDARLEGGRAYNAAWGGASGMFAPLMRATAPARAIAGPAVAAGMIGGFLNTKFLGGMFPQLMPLAAGATALAGVAGYANTMYQSQDSALGTSAFAAQQAFDQAQANPLGAGMNLWDRLGTIGTFGRGFADIGLAQAAAVVNGENPFQLAEGAIRSGAEVNQAVQGGLSSALMQGLSPDQRSEAINLSSQATAGRVGIGQEQAFGLMAGGLYQSFGGAPVNEGRMDRLMQMAASGMNPMVAQQLFEAQTGTPYDPRSGQDISGYGIWAGRNPVMAQRYAQFAPSLNRFAQVFGTGDTMSPWEWEQTAGDFGPREAFWSGQTMQAAQSLVMSGAINAEQAQGLAFRDVRQSSIAGDVTQGARVLPPVQTHALGMYASAAGQLMAGARGAQGLSDMTGWLRDQGLTQAIQTPGGPVEMGVGPQALAFQSAFAGGSRSAMSAVYGAGDFRSTWDLGTHAPVFQRAGSGFGLSAGQVMGAAGVDAGGIVGQGYASGGLVGAQRSAQAFGFDLQRARLGISQDRLASELAYQPQVWALQDQMTTLSRGHQDFGWEMQGRRMDLSEQQFGVNQAFQRDRFGTQAGWTTADIGTNVARTNQQRQWMREDWAVSDSLRSTQWGWQMSDFSEQIRFATGRQRRLGIRDQGRATVMHQAQEEEIERDRERQEQREAWQDEDFQKQRERHEQRVEWQDELFDIQEKNFEDEMRLSREAHQEQRDFLDEMRKLEDELRDLQRDHWKESMDFQKRELGMQAQQIQNQEDLWKLNNEITDIIDLNKGLQEEWLAGVISQEEASREWLTAIRAINREMEIGGMTQEEAWEAAGTPPPNYGGGPIMNQFGGPVMPSMHGNPAHPNSMPYLVGDGGLPELFVPDQAGRITPFNSSPNAGLVGELFGGIGDIGHNTGAIVTINALKSLVESLSQVNPDRVREVDTLMRVVAT